MYNKNKICIQYTESKKAMVIQMKRILSLFLLVLLLLAMSVGVAAVPNRLAANTPILVSSEKTVPSSRFYGSTTSEARLPLPVFAVAQYVLTDAALAVDSISDAPATADTVFVAVTLLAVSAIAAIIITKKPK